MAVFISSNLAYRGHFKAACSVFHDDPLSQSFLVDIISTMQSLLLGCNKLLVVIGKLVDVAVVVTVVVGPVDVVVGTVVVVEAVDSLLNSVEVVKVVNSVSDQINESFIKDSSDSKISISSTLALAGRVIGAIVGTKISFKIGSVFGAVGNKLS